MHAYTESHVLRGRGFEYFPGTPITVRVRAKVRVRDRVRVRVRGRVRVRVRIGQVVYGYSR